MVSFARRLSRLQYACQPREPQDRNRLRLSFAIGRVRRQRESNRVQPGRQLRARPVRRLAQHTEGLDHRHRAGDGHRHDRRHRPALAQLARRPLRDGLRGKFAQHPGAAATVLLICARRQALPAPRSALNPISGVFLSGRGLKFPKPVWQTTHLLMLVALLAGIGAAWSISRWASVRRERTASCFRRFR